VLPAYTYAQSNPVTYIDTNGLSIKAALTRWKAAASSKLDANRTRIQQFIKSLDPEKNAKSARFKAFATFKFPAVVTYHVTKDEVRIFGINPKAIAKKLTGVFHLH
jgi:hypothetical protein